MIMGMGRKLISMKIQAFQTPISKIGIADMIHLLTRIFPINIYILD
jgi:hypothetical protein